MASTKSKLSAAVLALIMVAAPATIILDQLLDEKEGNRLVAYPDGKGIWTVCRGATQVDGKPVVKGMKLSADKCAAVNQLEADRYAYQLMGSHDRHRSKWTGRNWRGIRG